MTDQEINFIVQALISPPPYGFTKSEREQVIAWLKSPAYYGRDIPVQPGKSYQFFQYG